MSDDTRDCPECAGSGEVWTGRREEFGQYITAPCRRCSGRGYIPTRRAER